MLSIPKALIFTFASVSAQSAIGQGMNVFQLRGDPEYRQQFCFCQNKGFVICAAVEQPNRPGWDDDWSRTGLVITFKSMPRIGVAYDLIRDSSLLAWRHFSLSNWGDWSEGRNKAEGFIRVISITNNIVEAYFNIVINKTSRFPYTYLGRRKFDRSESCGQHGLVH
ncbi:MAG: hypothetical protein EOO16_15790 [Chitinophagaceae bacterium]|nr:MAG: hypothetical protein EOO16_15790 [Chitinophagaceae bacterium]